MYTQKLFVHDGGKWQCAKRLHTGFVYFLRIFMLAFKFEGKVICEMPAFVVAAQ